jgi:methylenetetrahydrofolate--tRNA-(uracil-5-)-methyltransferase
LTVDRDLFAEEITRVILGHPRISVERSEVSAVPGDGVVIIATGPLTSDLLAADIARLTGSDRLYFYDSISPIVDDATVNHDIAFRASRYDKSLDGTGDYLNCPMNREEYDRFFDALAAAQAFESHIPGDVPYFESCLPIEEIARRGRDTLRFGPMKPVGLTDPRTGRYPYACVQLRQESLRAGSWNLVGFQNHLKFPEQKRVLRLIPGLENAEFLRYGQIHRNTYINAPALLAPTLQWKADPRVFFAGQISGVEGYVESIATGLIAGRNAAAYLCGDPIEVFPRETALGALCHYISGADPKNYQPANIAFDLFPPLDEQVLKRFRHDKKARHSAICERAMEALHGRRLAHV